jgi:phosphoribosylanthranilate isomerase
MTVKIKICGIKNKEDALFAAAAGADAVGLVFAKSSRRVEVAQAQAITAVLPPFVSRVGVFVDEERETVESIARACRLTALQFHGREEAGYCRGFALPVLKAVRVRTREDLRGFDRFPAAAFILDTYDPHLAGGTGRVFDWSLLAGRPDVPVILAGGLSESNVAEAVRLVRPYAVDVSGGVETNGKKDRVKMAAFIAAVRRCG